MTSEEKQKLDIEIKNAQTLVNLASKDFNSTQIEVNETRIKTIEKLAYFSSGTLALSLTFVGSLLSGNFLGYLQENVYCVPLIILLFLSWVFLLMSVVGSVVVRFWNASYLVYNSGYYWASSNKELKEKMMRYLAYGESVVFLDVDTHVQATENIKEGRKNYEDLEKNFKEKKEFYLKLVNGIKKMSVFSFVFGLIFLLMFAIIVVYRITFT